MEKIMPKDEKKYVLKERVDTEILLKCKTLENAGLTKEDRALVEFIKTQLEDDWRTPLLEKTDELIKKYKIRIS